MSDEERRTKTYGREYLTKLPEVVPAGKLLVHERPLHQLGRRVRAWLASETERDQYEPCDCDWARGLGIHYRVKDLSTPGEALARDA
jgi:hypothetical protein